MLVPILILLVAMQWHAVSPTGIWLAIASGSLASGVGYSIWYLVLPKLKSSQAGVVQLIVPVLATFAGVVFLNELLTMRLVIASALILGAVMVFLLAKRPVRT